MPFFVTLGTIAGIRGRGLSCSCLSGKVKSVLMVGGLGTGSSSLCAIGFIGVGTVGYCILHFVSMSLSFS